MRTFFELGWTPVSAHWSGSRVSLGQEANVELSLEQRDQLLASINAAMEKVGPLEDLIAWSSNNDPELRRTLSMNASRFWALSNSIAPLYPTVKEVAERLVEPEPYYWRRPLTDREASAIKQWTTGINEMYRIYEIAKSVAVAMPAGVEPFPGFTPQTTPAQPSPKPLSTKKSSTTDILIGGGVAATVGILLYAVL